MKSENTHLSLTKFIMECTLSTDIWCINFDNHQTNDKSYSDENIQIFIVFENLLLDWWWYFSMKTIFKFLGCPRIVRDMCQMSGFSSGSEVTYTDIRLKIYIYVSTVRSSLKGTLVWLVISAGWNRATMYTYRAKSRKYRIICCNSEVRVQWGSLPFGIFRNWFIF